MGGRYRTVGETQYRFELRLEITRVQLTGDLTGVGEIGPQWQLTRLVNKGVNNYILPMISYSGISNSLYSVS